MPRLAMWMGTEVTMQTVVRLILTLGVALAAMPVQAGKIGFLDTEGVIKTVKEGRRQLKILDDWANQRADEVEAIRDRVNELTKQLNTQSAERSDDDARKLENDLIQAQRDFEDAGRALKFDFENKKRELLDQVAARVRKIAGEYAAANGFDAVFMLGSQPLIYIADSAIITDAVVQLYNERFPIE